MNKKWRYDDLYNLSDNPATYNAVYVDALYGHPSSISVAIMVGETCGEMIDAMV